MDDNAIYCGMCHGRLVRAETSINENTDLLLCVNCGSSFSETTNTDGKKIYKYLGHTSGNNEIREILDVK